ncbi:MAG TPA: hypothetical protein VJK51_02825 [Candidatus Nanoarchaeia archaeon]|nr:hypothetical protein [Candidatus Nanoarchaeia archaeon]
MSIEKELEEKRNRSMWGSFFSGIATAAPLCITATLLITKYTTPDISRIQCIPATNNSLEILMVYRRGSDSVYVQSKQDKNLYIPLNEYLSTKENRNEERDKIYKSIRWKEE